MWFKACRVDNVKGEAPGLAETHGKKQNGSFMRFQTKATQPSNIQHHYPSHAPEVPSAAP